MPRTLLSSRRAVYWLAAAIALCVAAFAGFMQWREAVDERIVSVPLSPDDPEQERVGALVYRGGLDIPRMGRNIGGLSALRWDEASGRLLALTDDARFVWMTPIEKGGRLVGIETIETSDLLGLSGEALTGKEQGDSESLERTAEGAWAIGFERDHRVWVYAGGLDQPPVRSAIDPLEALGDLESNGGLEAMARTGGARLICAERQATPDRANCALSRAGGADVTPFAVAPSEAVATLGGVPTDAVAVSDDAFAVLFRSYSPADGNSAAIVAHTLTGERMEIATLRPPLSVDNFEGLAARKEGEGLSFYIVSDDNFSSNQRTLLMKFEWMPPVD
ncbi:MAG: esterase-like activity of phytase family protein [Pseudomonadota bacterium]